MVFTILDCNYRENDFYLSILLLMCSLKSYLSNKSKQCILTALNFTTLLLRCFFITFFQVTPPSETAPSRHVDVVLQSLANVLRDECVVVKSGWFGASDGDRTPEQVRKTKATLLICWGHVALGTNTTSLARHLDSQIVGKYSQSERERSIRVYGKHCS